MWSAWLLSVQCPAGGFAGTNGSPAGAGRSALRRRGSAGRPGWRAAVRAALGLVILLFLAGPASADRRVALVIGNAEYRLESLRLANPGNDARAIAAKLGELGFEVSLHTDLERQGMRTALESFSAAAKGADMAVFFYAGHGIQKDGENYLLGRDFTELSLAGLKGATLSLGDVQDAVSAGKPRLGIVIIDACRNNPFAEQGIVAPGLARASGGAGLLFAYSTDPGNVAYDGDGEHSQFTEALLTHLDSPGLDVRLMFGRVRQNVLLDTGGSQIPWVEESVIGEHSFSLSPMQPAGSAVAREIERWREISGQPGSEPYQKFLAEFPDGIFSEFAKQRLREPVVAASTDVAVGEVLTDRNRPVVAASLAILGYLPRSAGDRLPADSAIGQALGAYGAQSGEPVVDTERLYLDASRTLTLLGAKTAQQLRTDMALLSAVESAGSMAEQALAELEELARTSPEAQTVLMQARSDIKTIETRRNELLDQLDAGRTYYAELLRMARSDFEPMIRGVAANMTKEVRATEWLRDRHGSDIELFVRHVREQQGSRPDGSYSWMVDFLPG